MPDHSLSPPQDWSDAFARLGPETPPADGWARLSAQLQAHAAVEPLAAVPVQRRRGAVQRWAWAAAVAAALPLAALWLVQREADVPSPLPAAPVAAVDAAALPATQTPAAGPTPAITPSIAPTIAPAVAADTRSAAAATVPAAAPGQRRTPAASAPAALAQRTPRGATGAGDRERAAAPAPGAALSTDSAVDTAVAGTSAEDGAAVDRIAAAGGSFGAAALARLQGESAQLESLVALARDDRVGSGAATLMSAELDHGIAAIDAALSASGIGETERVALWQQRVDALRALAGVEGSQRWYAARGERYEDALVRVD
ncbi:hypothetical protein K4L06_01065 [Lysobacter sp. BMK333-48F3]|uniref:hypothetical protein n=1 Tax=Lysobacter sp. BMK333-48F3 TaxID=2867962 RepID=UPI001C8B9F26|nr:hypothetical protein [Lysobacter sp. BMK333-48F3]MBX9399884.1 hypothetical protein [Lysobacter sp. BMK333-48F3]